MADEYAFRYGRTMVTSYKLDILRVLWRQSLGILSYEIRTPTPHVVPASVQHIGDVIDAFRDYYIAEKAHFARWERGRPAPEWWNLAQRAK